MFIFMFIMFIGIVFGRTSKWDKQNTNISHITRKHSPECSSYLFHHINLEFGEYKFKYRSVKQGCTPVCQTRCYYCFKALITMQNHHDHISCISMEYIWNIYSVIKSSICMNKSINMIKV